MVKRQKEKQYQSSAEHKLNSQIRSGRGSGSGTSRPLPFTCCALTLTPYSNPVCCMISNKDSNDESINTGLQVGGAGRKINNHGIIFENAEIIPYLMKHRKNPITGEKMSSKSLITLNMDSAEDDGNGNSDSKHKWQCPILNKPFLNHTKIVAIVSQDRTSANVYSYEAVQTLNIKPKNYFDLISGEKFNPKKDMILLNDVNDESLLKLRDINNFVHMETLRKDHQSSNSQSDEVGNGNIQMSISAKRIMEKLQNNKKQQEEKERLEKKRKQQQMEEEEDEDGEGNGKPYYKKMKILTCDLGITYTKGQISGSFTSTSLPSYSSTKGNDIREATEEEILSSLFDQMKKLKRKAFVRMVTNLGHMDIELHCDIAPRTCMNFIGLVQKGWYDGTQFHRLIRNFMIQGGGSKNKKGGEKKKKKSKDDEQSIWGHPFQDEFDQRLKHVGPGVLSMANAGRNTNKCQFFITFKSAPHLDNKHSVFGKVVKGLDILREMENIPTDKSSDRPMHDVFIEKIVLFGDNPVSDAEAMEVKKIMKRMEERQRDSAERKDSALGKSKVKKAASKTIGTDTMKSNIEASKPQIGKYLQQAASTKKVKVAKQSTREDNNDDFVRPSRLPPPPKKTKFGDFSGW